MVGPGGTAMMRPLKWALEEGHQVWLFCPTNPYRTKETPKNYRFIPFVLETVKYYEYISELPKQEITDHLICLAAAYQLRAIANEFQPDVIHVHGIFFGVECCAQANLHPLVVSVWGGLNSLIEETEAPEEKIDKLTRTTFQAADVLIVETPNLVDKCKAWMSQFQKVELVPLGTKTQNFCPQPTKYVAQWRRALNIPEETTVLLSPRGWGKIYGHDQILSAYAMAYPRFQKPTVLVFLKLNRTYSLQQAKEDYIYFCTKAKEGEIEQNIRWLPNIPLEMMPTAYSLADVVINYPSTDAFPSTLVEAVACSRPVITAFLPAYKDTFIEQFCTLVEPQNPTALAEAMVEVVNSSSSEQEHHLKQARQFITEHYDEAVYKKKLLNIYAEAAASYFNIKA